jgi:hypothetical protein
MPGSSDQEISCFWGSNDPSIGPYPEPDESIPNFLIKIYFNIIPIYVYAYQLIHRVPVG